MTGRTVASRRAFLKTTALAGAALGGGATLSQANSAETEQETPVSENPASGKLKIEELFHASTLDLKEERVVEVSSSEP